MQQTLNIELTTTATRTAQALDEGWPVIVNEGGARCFHPAQRVRTNGYGLNSSLPISELEIGMRVWSYDEEKKEDCYSDILAVTQMRNTKPSIKLKLKNGAEIICTHDHKFYFSGRWVELKDLLSLPDVYSKKL